MVADGYKDTEIGVIPIEWEIDKLENLVHIVSGQSPSKFNLTGTEYKFFKVNQLNFCEKYLTNSEYAFDDEIENLLDSGTIIFPKRGASIFTNKVRILTHKSFIDTNLMGLITNKTLNNMFLYYWLVEFELSSIADTSSVPQINNKHINPLKIPLPPLKEQEKIAAILSTADDKIDAIALQLDRAETLKKGLLQKLLSEGIGHSEFKDSELGRIPLSWEVVELEKVAKLNKQKYTPIQSESINYIGLEHINQEQGTINGIGSSNDTLSQKNCFNVGEILFGKLRPYLQKFYLAEIDGVCSTEILVIKAKSNILNSILFQIVKTEAFIEHSVSKVFGTKMPRTSWAILQEFRLALPPLEEQKQIADILSTADEKLEVLRAKKQMYETLKIGLLQKLLSGEVRTV